MYIDIHTHHAAAGDSSVVSIRSCYSNFQQATAGGLFSIGLHPCHLQGYEQLFIDLLHYAASGNVMAIGECGLDKICNKDIDIQTALLVRQIVLANSLGKPLVIHCVRAFDEFLAIIARTPPIVPVIMHGFNKKGLVAARLMASGLCLSFGAAILNEGSPAANVLKNIPAHLFFLETDDAAMSIQEIYQKAASLRETTVEAITLQLQQNFVSVFKRAK